MVADPFLIQLSANAPEKQVIQVFGTLAPTQETQMQFQFPGFSQAAVTTSLSLSLSLKSMLLFKDHSFEDAVFALFYNSSCWQVSLQGLCLHSYCLNGWMDGLR